MRSKLLHATLLFIIGITTLSAAADRQRHRTGAPSQEVHTQKLDLAHYLPSDCFVYIQFRDLAGQIKAWQKSGLQERYYKSKSFEQWQKRHLAEKLSMR